ncbi:SMP-30/gluconolactonase/LRE family protein [soil metagenome]
MSSEMQASKQAVMQAVAVWESRCALGEGTVWNVVDGSLYFVDIKGREVLAYTPATGAQRRWRVPQMIGWVVPRAGGGWLAGFEQGVAALTLPAEPGRPGSAPPIEWLHRLHAEGSPLRLNDAKADAKGRLWFGSMNNVDDSQPEGVFYRWAAGSAPVPVDEGYCVTNGPAFAPDGRTLYHTDSARRCVYAFDVSADGELSNKRVWIRFEDDEGFPDGMCTDAEGCLWIAHWGGSRVTRRDAQGREIARIEIPARQVTNVAFGGESLRDLYVTTARTGLGDDVLDAAPLTGALFVVRGAGRGVLPGAFAG